jgi:ABC-type Fe3+ transport system permease subunit
MSLPVPNRNVQETATIAAGASLSGAVALTGRVITGILLPSAWTAADLTLSVSLDGVTYADLHDAAGESVFTVGASSFVGVAITGMLGFNYVKVRSGGSAAPVNQVAQRDIVLVLGDFTR